MSRFNTISLALVLATISSITYGTIFPEYSQAQVLSEPILGSSNSIVLAEFNDNVTDTSGLNVPELIDTQEEQNQQPWKPTLQMPTDRASFKKRKQKRHPKPKKLCKKRKNCKDTKKHKPTKLRKSVSGKRWREPSIGWVPEIHVNVNEATPPNEVLESVTGDGPQEADVDEELQIPVDRGLFSKNTWRSKAQKLDRWVKRAMILEDSTSNEN